MGKRGLQEDEVIYILDHPEERSRDLAKKYGRTKRMINLIRQGKAYEFIYHRWAGGSQGQYAIHPTSDRSAKA